MFHVKQNQELIEIKNCPLCSGNVFALYLDTKDYFYTQELFSLVQCEQCSFVFTNPVPAIPNKYYETPDYLSHNTENVGIYGRLYSIIRKINIKRKFRLVTTYCSSGNILDIGCGTGELLRFFASNGWVVTGIEPNVAARKFAKNKYSICVFSENELAKFESGTFDIISMWHVLEHVSDLHKSLAQIKRLLKDDGTLFISLPNFSSPESKTYVNYWSALDVPRHLYHFTQNTFVQLISKYNMKLIHAEPMKFDAYYVSLLSEKYLKNPLYFFSAIYNGYLSNLNAKKLNNYSSMIFVVKKQ